ncbi:hypothetical protein CHKEEEPN_1371 [Methylorubrum podarium]|nr:hypothetical protein CHKEEEPN_1371 [Methylorubrum podarium]
MIDSVAATQGGITLNVNMFSTVKIAFEVAVMREASVPGCRSAKNEGAWPVMWRKRSRRMSPVTPTKVKAPTRAATRQSMLSAAMKAISRASADQT